MALELLGEIDLIAMTHDLCAVRAPNSAEANAAAYASWRKRHGPAVQEANDELMKYESKLAPHLKTFSEGNISSVREARALLTDQMNTAADGRGPAYIASMCKGFPDFIASLEPGIEDRILSRRQAFRSAFGE